MRFLAIITVVLLFQTIYLVYASSDLSPPTSSSDCPLVEICRPGTSWSAVGQLEVPEAFNPSQFDGAFVPLLVAVGDLYNDFETVAFWRHDDVNKSTYEVCNHVTRSTGAYEACVTHVTFLVAPMMAAVEGRNIFIVSVKAAMNLFNVSLGLSRFQFVVVMQLFLLELLPNPSKTVSFIGSSSSDLLILESAVKAALLASMEAPAREIILEVPSEKTDGLLSVSSSGGNAFVWLRSCLRILNPHCRHNEQILQTILQRFTVQLPLGICLVDFSDANFGKLLALLSRLFSRKISVPSHLGASSTLECFLGARSSSRTDLDVLKAASDSVVSFLRAEDHTPHLDLPGFESEEEPKTQILRSLSKRPISKRTHNVFANVSAVSLRTSYGNHFPHWTMMLTYTWSIIRWHEQLGLPPVTIIFDRMGSGPGRHWIKSFRLHFRTVWPGIFVHDQTPAAVDNFGSVNSGMVIVDSHLTGDHSWRGEDTWFMHKSDGRLLTSLMFNQNPPDKLRFRERYQSTYNTTDAAGGCGGGCCPTALKLLLLAHKITVVDRVGSRGISNGPEVLAAIEQLSDYGLPAQDQLISNQLSTNRSAVTLQYLDDKTFMEQVELFRGTELLIIGHGAAVTNILFMAPCAVVIELMPWGYLIPGMYGGLAADMGLVYKSLNSLSPFPEYARFCPAAEYQDCRVGENNMTTESFRCRSCVRTNGRIIADIPALEDLMRSAVEERAVCLLQELAHFDY
jgi:hypothetical protein